MKNILLYFFTELKTYIYLFLFTNMMLSTLLILTVNAGHVSYELCNRPHSPVSVAQWSSSGARNPKVWGLIPHGESECFLCLMLVTRRKTSFYILYWAQNLPSLLFYLQTVVIIYHSLICIRSHQTLLKSFNNLQRLNLFIHLKPRECPNQKENQLSRLLDDVLSHITELSSWSATKEWHRFLTV